MQIEFRVDTIDGFLPLLAEQLNVNFKGNQFDLPSQLGRGTFIQQVINDDILLVLYQLQLDQEINIVRHASKNLDVLPITFWLSNNGIQQELNAEHKVVGMSSDHAIFFPSNQVETKYQFPKNEQIENLTIFIHKSWLKTLVPENNDYINTIILNQDNFFLYETPTLEIIDKLREVKDCMISPSTKSTSKLQLYSLSFQLLTLFFQQVEKRDLSGKHQLINSTDIALIFKVKDTIELNYKNIPKVSSLAQSIGMNLRKMQTLFKQIFGFSIYQFGLSIRMMEAKKLLLLPQHNVAEVGHLVGYSNLSHFTEQFKKFYGITPKAFQKQN
ncbi:helix-turn-helix domain-containing protein [Flammeovirga pacifica]|uniref:HTH araC/xylS-type domain-containing protein n=1 Tax=Flammeovirga pacifica TaxID=915059 RepID=A0A1S1YUH3_FLAPC|nr:AraC family transcriptional regulator [Flammeovirga pacifica]OHX64455.1 hypothetical protein NH26_22995 [Flammeovirga pacifica]